MMDEYAALAAVSPPAAREAALDAWLARYGHRGPLESDPARPRFAELRELLLRDLASSHPAIRDSRSHASPRRGRSSPGSSAPGTGSTRSASGSATT